MFYALGSLLFALSMMAAFAVMAHDFARYRHAMIAALRGLSLDGWSGETQAATRSANAAASFNLPLASRSQQAVA